MQSEVAEARRKFCRLCVEGISRLKEAESGQTLDALGGFLRLLPQFTPQLAVLGLTNAPITYEEDAYGLTTLALCIICAMSTGTPPTGCTAFSN